MQKQHLLVSLLTFVLCISCNNTEKCSFPPLHFYLEPTEEHVWDATHFPDFVNYSNDWSKMGLKGNVETVAYSTIQPLRWVFRPDGKLQNVTYVLGDDPYELRDWYFYYDKDTLLKHTVYDAQKVKRNRKARSFKGNPVDEITCHANGKLDTRSFMLFNKLVTKKQYNYNDKGICTSISLIEGKAPDCDIAYNEQGQISSLKLKQTRIPAYGLASGSRSLIPTYDKEGRISTVTSMSVPCNKEAHNIDSIFSISRYEYNAENDIVVWHYADTVYPQEVGNAFEIAIDYVYDEHGNWIEKQIIGASSMLKTLMNSYYQGNYFIDTSEVDESGKSLGKIVLKRDITYFKQTDGDAIVVEPVSETTQEVEKKKPISSQAKSLLKGDIKFAAPNLKYWKVEKVICNGRKNRGYEFVITGVFTEDCSDYTMGRRMVTVAVKEKSKMEVTSAGAYVFPAGKTGENFSFEVVSAYDGMCNINDFEFLVLLQE